MWFAERLSADALGDVNALAFNNWKLGVIELQQVLTGDDGFESDDEGSSKPQVEGADQLALPSEGPEAAQLLLTCQHRGHHEAMYGHRSCSFSCTMITPNRMEPQPNGCFPQIARTFP